MYTSVQLYIHCKSGLTKLGKIFFYSGDCVFYSYLLGSRRIEAFSLCMFLLLSTPREVPHGMKGTGPKFVTRPVYSRSQLRNNTNTVSVLVLLIYLFHTLYTRDAGIAHHRALQTSRRGWADSKAAHGMECSGGAHALLISVGAAACGVPYCQYRKVCSPRRPNASQANELSMTTDPRFCARVVYIAGDTLRHQPMEAGHMTVLQLSGPMAFGVLQWCHQMLASSWRTSCCTRMITLYGARNWIQACTFPSPS